VREKSGRVPTKVYFSESNTKASRARAEAFELPHSTYHAILLRNEVYAGVPGIAGLPPISTADEQVRVEIPLSLSAKLYKAATNYAKARGGTVSRLLEELVERDTTRGGPLTIYPVGKKI